ncbi:hypothetical protein EMIHUDRAFT_366582, partial [Emiliania huxleyi CCMP1516]|uniref:Uncharacterized protein n=2 Tax=Emiliania huxleyi TaxID=2903 RepID=A0A0D3JVG4_EMIH1
RPEDIQRQWLQRQMDYNERPYENRGWCLFEQGVAMTVAAHLAAAEAQAARAGKELPLRFRRAQELRAKVYDIGGPEPVARSCASPPLTVLEEAFAAIGSSRFTGKGDAAKVLQMLAEFEWVVRSTFQQALECHARSGATLPPAARGALAEASRLAEANGSGLSGSSLGWSKVLGYLRGSSATMTTTSTSTI